MCPSRRKELPGRDRRGGREVRILLPLDGGREQKRVMGE